MNYIKKDYKELKEINKKTGLIIKLVKKTGGKIDCNTLIDLSNQVEEKFYTTNFKVTVLDNVKEYAKKAMAYNYDMEGGNGDTYETEKDIALEFLNITMGEEKEFLNNHGNHDDIRCKMDPSFEIDKPSIFAKARHSWRDCCTDNYSYDRWQDHEIVIYLPKSNVSPKDILGETMFELATKFKLID